MVILNTAVVILNTAVVILNTAVVILNTTVVILNLTPYPYNPATFLSLSKARIWYFQSHILSVFVYRELRWEMIAHFLDIGGIVVRSSLFKISFNNH